MKNSLIKSKELAVNAAATLSQSQTMSITTIELPIYEVDVIVLIAEDWSRDSKRLKLDLDLEDLDADGITILNAQGRNKQEVYLFFKPEYLDYNAICHLKGIRADEGNDEPLAYLQGYLADKIFSFRDKYLEKIKENT